jgi:hypothetical protein
MTEHLVSSQTVTRTAANFVIGTIGGLASVFLPRMMLLLSIDTEPAPERYISLIPWDFVWLGLGFGIVVGAICAILQHGGAEQPKAVFMTALGIPALLSGVLNTTSATSKLQRVEHEKVAVLRAVGNQADISQERVNTIQPLGASSPSPGSGSPVSSRQRFFFSFVTPAYAQSAAAPPAQARNFDPGIQIRRPSYVVALRRASSHDEAVRLARALQKDIPTAQAVKTDQGYFVVDSLTPRSEASALLDAIQLKSRRGFNPSLLRVPER